MRQRRTINHHITDAVWKGFGIWLLIAAICLIYVAAKGCTVERKVETKIEHKSKILKHGSGS